MTPGAFIKRNAAWLFFFCLAIFRLSLITKGHNFEYDEVRYFNAIFFWRQVLNEDFSQAILYLFNAQGRPGFVLLSLIPAAVQTFFLVFDGGALLNNPYFFNIPSFFNALLTLGVSFIFYRILALLGMERSLALFGTVVYSLLVNSNVYIRHLAPYDQALLMFLLNIFLILRKSKTGLNEGAMVTFGALSAAGFLVYPGYYAFALIILIFIAFTCGFRWRLIVTHVLSFICILLLFEIAANLLGQSYIESCLTLSATATHGDFSEGVLFIFRYLRDVEGAIGMILLGLFLLYTVFFWHKDKGAAKWLIAAAFFLHVFHAGLGFIFNKTVFYGRILHMYFPFLVMGAVRALQLLPKPIIKKSLCAALAAASVFSFVRFAYTYLPLSYPRDVYFVNAAHLSPQRVLWIGKQYIKYRPGLRHDNVVWIDSMRDFDAVKYKGCSAAVVNFESYFIGGLERSFAPVELPGMELIAAEPHPLTFPSYTFEHYGPEDRRVLREKDIHMQIYMRLTTPRR